MAKMAPRLARYECWDGDKIRDEGEMGNCVRDRGLSPNLVALPLQQLTWRTSSSGTLPSSCNYRSRPLPSDNGGLGTLHAAGLVGAANGSEERPDQEISSMNPKLYPQCLQRNSVPLTLLTTRLYMRGRSCPRISGQANHV
jgi:hypothetical protein